MNAMSALYHIAQNEPPTLSAGNWYVVIYNVFFYYLFSVIVRVRVVFRKTIVGDWRFDYLSGSHLQSQVQGESSL